MNEAGVWNSEASEGDFLPTCESVRGGSGNWDSFELSESV